MFEDRDTLRRLRELLSTRFSSSELANLSFDLGVPLDVLPGQGTTDKAREIVYYYERRCEVDRLVNYILQSRRDITLADISQPVAKGSHGSLEEDFKRLAELMDSCDSPPLGRKGEKGHTRLMAAMTEPVDSIRFAREFGLRVQEQDPNKDNWANLKGRAVYDSIDGFWCTRWRTQEWNEQLTQGPDDELTWSSWHEGTAEISFHGDWVHICIEDDTNRYIMRCREFDGKRLIGRYMNCSESSDHRAWVGNIVDCRRIDGTWESGWAPARWDFRR